MTSDPLASLRERLTPEVLRQAYVDAQNDLTPRGFYAVMCDLLLAVLEPWARAQQEQIDRLQSALRDRSTTAEEAIMLHWQPALEAAEAENARLRSLLNYALNGWGAHAKKNMEQVEIGRIRQEAARPTPAQETE